MADKNIQMGFTEGTYYERLYDSSLSLIKTIEKGLQKCYSLSDLTSVKELITVVEGSSSVMAKLYSNYFGNEVAPEVIGLNDKLSSIRHRVLSLENSLKSP